MVLNLSAEAYQALLDVVENLSAEAYQLSADVEENAAPLFRVSQ